MSDRPNFDLLKFAFFVVILVPSYKQRVNQAIERGDNGLFITLVPKVLT